MASFLGRSGCASRAWRRAEFAAWLLSLGPATAACGADEISLFPPPAAAEVRSPDGGADACPPGELCGIPVACVSDSNCPFACDETRHLCVECFTSIQCESRRPAAVCDSLGGRCVECLSPDDCRSGPRKLCELPRGLCVECRSASDCQRDQSCTSGQCAARIP